MGKEEKKKEGKEEGDGKTVDTMTKTELNAVFKQIGSHFKQQGEALAGVFKAVQELTAAGPQKGADDDEPDGKPAPTNTKAIEEMSRVEFGDYLLSRMEKEGLAPVRQAIQQGSDTKIREGLSTQVNAANEAHADFSKWHDEIKDTIKAHPTMDVEAAYQLVRAQDPTKSGGIDVELKKAADEVAAKKEKETPDNVIPATFGGLLPTSGQTSSKEDGAMTSKEAGEAAWDAVHVGEHLKAVSEN